MRSSRTRSSGASQQQPGQEQLDQPALRYGTARGRWVLAATVLGSGMASLDATVVGIALPAIARDFHAQVDSLQWVVDGYTLTLAGLLLLGGALGDSLGRRKVFIIGCAWFTAASLACGLAPDVGFLIAARALQGAGAALLTPGSLAILQASFAVEDRPRAIGAWSGLGGVSTAIGPFLGGWLISAVSWRLVFFINLPLAIAVMVIAARHVPESRAPAEEPSQRRQAQRGQARHYQPRIDITGAVTISLSLAGITYGLIEAPARGWTSASVLLSLAAGVVLLAVFLLAEARESQPMLPLGIFRSRQFSAANAVTFVVYGAMGGLFFLLPVVLQEVSGYSPLEAGAALLPVTALMLLLSARAAALAARIGPRLPMTVGPLLIAAGMTLFARVHGNGDYLTQVLPAALVFGLGTALNVAPLTATALSAAPAEHAGVASAVNNAVARAASLIAVAVLPVAAGITGDVFLHPAALTRTFHVAVFIAAAWCAAGGLLAFATIRNPGKTKTPLTERPPSPAPERPAYCCGVDGPPLRLGPAASPMALKIEAGPGAASSADAGQEPRT